MSGSGEQERGVAAFFDIDGTLVPEPSLERRLFRELKRAGAIPWMNYLHWGMEAARMLPQGLTAIAHERAENAHLADLARRLREDPDAIEEIARRELGLIKPGEKVFIVKDVAPPTK